MDRISVTTLGCKLNFSESTSIVRKFMKEGNYTIVPFGDPSDVTIINTCSVTSQAERKSRYAVKKASKVSPAGKIVVIGCSAQLRPEIFGKIEGVDLVLGAKEKFNVFDLLKLNTKRRIYACEIDTVNNFDIAYSVSERTRSFLKIQDGCDYPCTYCTIPKARGKSRNTTIDTIIAEAKKIAKQGAKEIVLTGVNIGDFGKSTNQNFLQLIKELDNVEGIERFRISSIEPNLLTTEVIEFVAQSKKFMPHFHIPLQSGSDNVLKLMKRRYNTSLFNEKILKSKELIPDSFFGIDVIVGFPGETEENFIETYSLLESLPISFLHIFPYSDRPGTVATEMKNKVPSEWIKLREQKLQKLSNKKHTEFYENYLGTIHKVLFESKTKDNKITGFTNNYIRVKVDYNKKLENTIQKVKLIEIDGDTVNGKIISE